MIPSMFLRYMDFVEFGRSLLLVSLTSIKDSYTQEVQSNLQFSYLERLPT